MENFLTPLCLFISCWKIQHFRAFYKKWVELFSDPVTRELGLEPTNCRRGVIVITLTGTLVFVFNVTACGIATFCERISIQIYSTGGNIPPKIKDIRTRHLRLCDLLDTYNLFLKWHLTVTYTATIIGCCFIQYELIVRHFDAFGYALNIFWLLTNALTALALSFSLSHLHEAAHEPLELLFKLETDNTNLSQVLQVQLFLSKLTGTIIGATVLDLFVVTKETLLTIAEAYVTYFLLMIQFNI